MAGLDKYDIIELARAYLGVIVITLLLVLGQK